MDRRVIKEIGKERLYQDQKWGGQAHDDCHSMVSWTGFALTELQEAAEEARAGNLVAWYTEMCHVAAVCVAAMEAALRRRVPDEQEDEPCT